MEGVTEILIADDHPVFRRGLRQIIESESDIVVVYEAADGQEALNYLRETPPHIAVLDIDMPKLHGIDVARTVQKEDIPVDIMILTMYKDEHMFNRAMDAGVKAYVLKENAVTDILQGIRTVGNNHYYISPIISEYLIRRSGGNTSFTSRSIDDLTPTERKILRFIAEEKTSKDIGEALFISFKTVENHRTNICRKLGIHGPNSLLRFVIENKGRI